MVEELDGPGEPTTMSGAPCRFTSILLASDAPNSAPGSPDQLLIRLPVAPERSCTRPSSVPTTSACGALIRKSGVPSSVTSPAPHTAQPRWSPLAEPEYV